MLAEAGWHSLVLEDPLGTDPVCALAAKDRVAKVEAKL